MVDLQNLPIEEAKRLRESLDRAVDEISHIGYEDASFFRRLFSGSPEWRLHRRVVKPIHRALPAAEPRRRRST
jgi:hypothetical protein